jgi:hypothetical protein
MGRMMTSSAEGMMPYDGVVVVGDIEGAEQGTALVIRCPGLSAELFGTSHTFIASGLICRYFCHALKDIEVGSTPFLDFTCFYWAFTL